MQRHRREYAQERGVDEGRREGVGQSAEAWSVKRSRESCWLVRSAWLLPIAVYCACTNSYADAPLPRTFNHPRHGFSVSLPEGWTEMAPEQVEAANRAMESQLPRSPQPLLHYGYRMTNETKLAFPPWLLIRVTDKPSSRKAALKDLEQDSQVRLEGVQFQRGKPWFDDQFHACIVDYQCNLPGRSVDATAACFLTKQSEIKMFFYYPRDDQENVAALTKRIIKSVRISDEIGFAPEPKPLRGGLVIAMTAIVIMVLVLARAKPGKSP
jgi:hypothetical protein